MNPQELSHMSAKSLLPIYFILVFIISTGAVLILLSPNGLPAAADQKITVGMAILLGPSIAGILLTGLASGKAGFRELLSRLLRWRVSVRWYAAALLTAPLTAGAVIFAFSLFSSDFAPNIMTSNDKAALLLQNIPGALIVAFFEELGWTGFAIPQMRKRFGIFAAGLITGLFWGLWHFPLFWERDSFSGALSLAVLLACLFSWLPAYRIIMSWVYDHTRSLLVVMLMHVSLVITVTVIDPPVTGESLLAYVLVRAALLWICAAAVTAAVRRAEPAKLSQSAS
jgi:membrane protease YdiL (CAAX protease family)